MVEHLLFANEACNTAKQAAGKNQIIQMKGYNSDKYVVYDIRQTKWGLSYGVINLRTHEFGQCDLIRPLSMSRIYGAGYYYDDTNPQFMDAFEVAILQNEAEQIAGEKEKERKAEQGRDEQLRAIGRERLKTLIPEDAKAAIIAELHENESDSMTDYYGYRTQRTVLLGFSTHTRDLFSEMRKYAANFTETAYLTEDNKDYEHREKYSMGDGYYLGKSKYGGWIITKERIYDREKFIERFALVAGDEANICGKVQADAKDTPATVAGDFIIVDYSEKAIAVFGDTRPVKDELKALGGRFNPKLSHEGEKRAGWIFSRSKESKLINLLTIK
ncbi:MAG: fusion protein [Dysgonamonadaceae bacterium]|nr:fusion protein [Dysgonamonadaceae bacterium]